MHLLISETIYFIKHVMLQLSDNGHKELEKIYADYIFYLFDHFWYFCRT